jgi:hypothetical protein
VYFHLCDAKPNTHPLSMGGRLDKSVHAVSQLLLINKPPMGNYFEGEIFWGELACKRYETRGGRWCQALYLHTDRNRTHRHKKMDEETLFTTHVGLCLSCGPDRCCAFVRSPASSTSNSNNCQGCGCAANRHLSLILGRDRDAPMYVIRHSGRQGATLTAATGTVSGSSVGPAVLGQQSEVVKEAVRLRQRINQELAARASEPPSTQEITQIRNAKFSRGASGRRVPAGLIESVAAPVNPGSPPARAAAVPATVKVFVAISSAPLGPLDTHRLMGLRHAAVVSFTGLMTSYDFVRSVRQLLPDLGNYKYKSKILFM